MISFIDEVREQFGVEPVCRVLSEHGVRIAPRTYYAAKTRPPSARAVRDERAGRDRAGARRPPGRARLVWRPQGVPPATPRGRRRRPARLVPAGRTAHAVRRPARRPPRQKVHHDEAGHGSGAAAGPGQARLHRARPEPAVAGRLHLRPDVVRDGVHRVRLRRVLAADRGLAHRRLDARQPAAGRPGDGAMDPRTGSPHHRRPTRRLDPPLGRRIPAQVQGVVATPHR